MIEMLQEIQTRFISFINLDLGFIMRKMLEELEETYLSSVFKNHTPRSYEYFLTSREYESVS